jgi:predicted phage terminase large subunit-like protein
LNKSLIKQNLKVPTLQQVESEICKRSLYEFIKRSWNEVEAGTKFVDGWHIKAICTYLEACVRGDIQNLIINIPPRHMKSLITNVFFPAWIWTFSPEKKFIFTSYAQNLATRDSVKCRKLLESEWYQKRFKLELASDNNQKMQYDNTAGGFRYSFGFNSVTGQGGDYIIVDDPLDADKSSSVIELNNVNWAYDNVIFNRLNDFKTGVRIIIMQRLHENDLVGHILENKSTIYEQLILPAVYDGTRFESSIGFKDPRTEIGELLWKDKFGNKEIDALKGTLGDAGYAGQYLQRPSPQGGFIYKSDWLKDRVDRTDLVATFISVDTSYGNSNLSDYSAFVVGSLTSDYKLYIREVYRNKLAFPQLVDDVERLGRKYSHNLNSIIVESKASGLSLIQTIKQSSNSEIRDILHAFNPTSDKTQRGSSASIWCENGSVLLPPPNVDSLWLFDFEDELFKFPNSKYDDMSDAFAQLILFLENYLAEGLRIRQDTPIHNQSSIPVGYEY